MNNENSDITGLTYIPVDSVNDKKESSEKELRAELFAKAKEMGLTPARNITTEELKKLTEN